MLLSPSQGVAQDFKLDADDLFADEQIVDIRIDLPEESWDTLRNQSRSFVDSLQHELAESPFTNVKANISINGVEIKDVAIRKKGFLGSLDNNRPSLKIKFNEYVDQKPIKGLDRLTLNNNKQDAGRMCQYLSYRMFNRSGTVSPRCSFAKVTVNGKYLGIYSNVEAVRKPFLKAGFGSSSGSLFEGTVTDFFPAWVNRFEAKTKKSDPAVVAKISEIMSEDNPDLEELGKWVDLPAFMKFWAMESLIGFWDGYCNNQNNYFIYQRPDNSKLYFIPWGVDSSYAKTMPLPPYRVRPRSVHSKAILPNKLYRNPETQEMYQQTLMDLLDTYWNEEELVAEINRAEALLEDEIMESNRGFSRGVRNYRRFVESRRKEIMGEFEEGPPELRSRESMPAYFGQIGEAKVKFKTGWYKRLPKDLNETSSVDLELIMDGEPVEMKDVIAYTERSKSPAPFAPPSTTDTAIIISGTRKSDGKQLMLATSLPTKEFSPSNGEEVEVNGIFMLNNQFMSPGGAMRMIGGTAILEEAAPVEGEPVSGTLKLKIMELKGGKPVSQ